MYKICSCSFEINDEKMKGEEKKDGKEERVKERKKACGAAMGGRAYRAARVPLSSRIKPLKEAFCFSRLAT